MICWCFINWFRSLFSNPQTCPAYSVDEYKAHAVLLGIIIFSLNARWQYHMVSCKHRWIIGRISRRYREVIWTLPLFGTWAVFWLKPSPAWDFNMNMNNNDSNPTELSSHKRVPKLQGKESRADSHALCSSFKGIAVLWNIDPRGVLWREERFTPVCVIYSPHSLGCWWEECHYISLRGEEIKGGKSDQGHRFGAFLYPHG